MRFYKTQAQGSSAHGVMARDGDELYSYLPNTDLWHRSPELGTDFYFDQEGIYAEVAPEEVPSLMAEVPRVDERGTSGLYVRRRRSQPLEDIRTSADLGLIVGTRQATSKGVLEFLRKSAVNRWVAVALYRKNESDAAIRQIKYELLNGKKRTYEVLGPIEVRVVNLAGHDVQTVQVRKVRKEPAAG